MPSLRNHSVTGWEFIQGLPFCPDSAVFVVLNMRLWSLLLSGHEVSSDSLANRQALDTRGAWKSVLELGGNRQNPADF